MRHASVWQISFKLGTLILSFGLLCLSAFGYPYQTYKTAQAVSGSGSVTIINTCNETSLRAALTNGGTIHFNCDGVISLAGGIQISVPTILDATGHSVTFSGQVIDIGDSIYGGSPPPVDVTFQNITVTNGWHPDGPGGGFIVFPNGVLHLDNSAITNNYAYWGGGIYNNGTVYLNNTTVAGNHAEGWCAFAGGGIFSDGRMNITNSTIVGNSAYGSGGGIFNKGVMSINNTTIAFNTSTGCIDGGGIQPNGPVTFTNSIVANNVSQLYANCGNFPNPNVYDGGANIVYPQPDACNFTVGDPKLSPTLANNGGPTQTLALQAGSAAINGGDPASCLAYDQRYAPRLGQCDIGAFEYNGTPATLLPPALQLSFVPNSIPNGNLSQLQFTVVNTNPLIPLSNISFQTTLPYEITPGPNPGITTDCGPNNIVQVITQTISVNGGLVGAGQSCKASLAVSSTISGTWTAQAGPIFSMQTGLGGLSNTADLKIIGCSSPLEVNSLQDSTAIGCTVTLRQALLNASSNSTISFAPALGAAPTITLTSALSITPIINIGNNNRCLNPITILTSSNSPLILEGNNHITGIIIKGQGLKLQGRQISFTCTIVKVT